jgi:hypothetical protein
LAATLRLLRATATTAGSALLSAGSALLPAGSAWWLPALSGLSTGFALPRRSRLVRAARLAALPLAVLTRRQFRVRRPSVRADRRWPVVGRDDVPVVADLGDALVVRDVELVGVQHRSVARIVTHGACYGVAGKKTALRSSRGCRQCPSARFFRFEGLKVVNIVAERCSGTLLGRSRRRLDRRNRDGPGLRGCLWVDCGFERATRSDELVCGEVLANLGGVCGP